MLELFEMTGTIHRCSNLESRTAAVHRTFLTRSVSSIRTRQVRWVGRSFQPRITLHRTFPGRPDVPPFCVDTCREVATIQVALSSLR
jgi:hypothetical protein